jgi:predicted acylesterase/phospholipase RssA
LGLTLIEKSDGRPKRNPRIALVLAGGAISGGAFKVGGLKALDDCLVGRKITDLDCYVGLSAGAILATTLASGISPAEMIRVLEGRSARIEQLRPIDFYQPNFSEFVSRPARLGYEIATYLPTLALDFARALPGLPRAMAPSLRRFAGRPSYTRFEAAIMDLLAHVSPKRGLPSPTNHLPSGFFDNRSLARWVAHALEKSGMPDDFRAFAKRSRRELYLTACDLDSAERVVFGANENCEVPISQAVAASTALPIFYKPARVGGVDYVDGGVRHTASIDIAIEKGADLIICYNPFRPFLNRERDGAEGGPAYDDDSVPDARAGSSGATRGYLSDRGLKTVVNQAFRTLLHSRLELGLERYASDASFRGDIVLLEPREADARFFDLNPLAFWKRSEALEHGFASVQSTIRRHYGCLSAVLARYGLRLDAARAGVDRVRRSQAPINSHSRRARDHSTLRIVGAKPR